MNHISCILVIYCSMNLVIAASERQMKVSLAHNCIWDCIRKLCDDDDTVETWTENGTWTKNGNMACDDMMNKLETVKKYSMAFEKLLSKTVVNVSLRNDSGAREKCMRAYNTWLCATQFTFYNNNSMENHTCKPTIRVCNMVVQNCPYYTPSRHQKVKGCKREVIHGGLPAFMCPKKGSEYEFEDNSGPLNCSNTS